NAPTEELFVQELKRAIKRGIILVNVSQCAGGRVMQGRYNTSKQLKEIGVVSGVDLTLEAAVTKLMMVLAEEEERCKVETRMKASICGEMTLN
ncbi:MAG: L-asparaginase 1, partial [Bacteroidota bacterium]